MKVNTKQYEAKNARLKKGFNREWIKLLYKYGDLITKRMSLIHLYMNRTGKLSKSNKYKVTVKSKRLTFRNNTFYAVYVRRWERRKRGGSDAWGNAIAYYRPHFKKDLENIPKRIK